MSKKPKQPLVVRGLDSRQWLEIKYLGITYTVCLSTLLDSYKREQARD